MLAANECHGIMANVRWIMSSLCCLFSSTQTLASQLTAAQSPAQATNINSNLNTLFLCPLYDCRVHSRTVSA